MASESVLDKVIVVGGGLAGLSAAHSVLEAGGRVLMLDKNAFMGGNSTKATSGINAALTRQQQRVGIPDSVDQFLADTAKSATSTFFPRRLVRVIGWLVAEQGVCEPVCTRQAVKSPNPLPWPMYWW